MSNTPHTPLDERWIARIKDIVCRILEVSPEELTENSRFVEDHDADSLRAIEILAELEKEFDILIEQEELAKMTSLAEVCAVMQDAVAGQGGSRT